MKASFAKIAAKRFCPLAIPPEIIAHSASARSTWILIPAIELTIAAVFSVLSAQSPILRRATLSSIDAIDAERL